MTTVLVILSIIGVVSAALGFVLHLLREDNMIITTTETRARLASVPDVEHIVRETIRQLSYEVDSRDRPALLPDLSRKHQS